MKVLDMLNKITDLKELRDDLNRRSNADEVIGSDADLMDRAGDAIDDYIRELYRKDVKE